MAFGAFSQTKWQELRVLVHVRDNAKNLEEGIAERIKPIFFGRECVKFGNAKARLFRCERDHSSRGEGLS